MNTINRIKRVVVGVALGLGLLSAQAGSPYYTTNISANSGITYVGPNGTSNAATTCFFAVKNNEEVGVHWTSQLGAADTTSPTNILVLFTSPTTNSADFSTNRTIIMNSAGTGVARTNFSLYVGSMGYVGIYSIRSSTTNFSTNRVWFTVKENRHGQFN